MAIKSVDRVRAISTTTGTADLALSSTPSGYQSFATALLDGDSVYYTAVGQTDGQWEVGIGTYSSGVLARTRQLSSSSAGAKVPFTAGGVNVFVSIPAHSVNRTTGGTTLVVGNITMEVGGTYFVTNNSTVTLPAGAVAGDVVVVMKMSTATPVVSGGVVNIITEYGTDTSVSVDVDLVLNFVFNGTAWEMKQSNMFAGGIA